MSWACGVHRERREEVYTGFWWEGVREGDPDVHGRIILRWIFRKWDGVWTGSSWLSIVTGGTHLCVC